MLFLFWTQIRCSCLALHALAFNPCLRDMKTPVRLRVHGPNENRPDIKAFHVENGQRKYLNPPSVHLSLHETVVLERPL